ncbi:hypothetical protein, partial [Xanthomonas nasturtii]
GRGILEPGAPVAADLWCLKGIFQGRPINAYCLLVKILNRAAFIVFSAFFLGAFFESLAA